MSRSAKPLFFLLFAALSLRTAQGQEITLSTERGEAAVSGAVVQWPIGCEATVVAPGANSISFEGTLYWGEMGYDPLPSGTSDDSYYHLRYLREVPATADDMIVRCEATFWLAGLVNFPINRTSSATVPGLRPYSYVSSDTGNVPCDRAICRTLWYQVMHHTGQIWEHGGQVSEAFLDEVNPCAIEIEDGIDSLDSVGRYYDTFHNQALLNPPRPECAVAATQRHLLDTAFDRVLIERRWRWEPSGIWQIW